MAKRRIQKKRLKREAVLLERHHGEAASLYAPRELTVAVSCPRCSRPSLKRTYLPVIGSMSGKVKCIRRCGYEDLYINALAQAMDPVDPIPVHYSAPRVRAPMVAPIDRLTVGRAIRAVLHFLVFGTRRDWELRRPLLAVEGVHR